MDWPIAIIVYNIHRTFIDVNDYLLFLGTSVRALSALPLISLISLVIVHT